MSRIIIFANGELNPPHPTGCDFYSDDYFIAVDGGARHCKKLGITPMTLIGDFDSLDAEEIARLRAIGVQILTYPSRKDQTDLELALIYATQQNPEEIRVYAALGARWDMTLANLLLLAYPRFQASKIFLIDGYQTIRILWGESNLLIHGNPGDTISIISLSPQAKGITTHDLEYPLQDGVLTLGSTLGVSNTMVSNQCQISLNAGLLAVIHIHQMIE